MLSVSHVGWYHVVLTQPADRQAGTLTDLLRISTAAPSTRADGREEASRRPFHRYRTRLTAGGPGLEHLTRRMVPCGAHTAG